MWLSKYNWLTYSKIKDGANCKFYVLFSNQLVGHTSSQTLGAFCDEPFRNWKKATEKIEEHQSHGYHKSSVIKSQSLKKALEVLEASIENLINQSYKQAIENRKKLEPIIKTIIFCGHNNLPLRGHRDWLA